MNAKDLLNALNDIDPKLLKDADPWAEPSKKIRRPVWAVAAAIVLCLGIGVAMVVANQQVPVLPQGSPAPSSALPAVTLTYGDTPQTGMVLPPEGITYQSLTQEQIAALWGQEDLRWGDVDVFAQYDVEGSFSQDSAGNLWEVTLTGTLKGQAKYASNQVFSIRLAPNMVPSYGDPADMPWNNTVNGVPVYAASYPMSMSPAPVETAYSAQLLWEGDNTVGLSATVTSRETGLTDEEADALLCALVGQTTSGGVTLEEFTSTQEPTSSSSSEDLMVGQESAEHPDVDLTFLPRPAEDETFSNVWNTFTTLYLEPQNLAAHGAEPDYTLSEEGLASIWGGVLPWRDLLTENDSVEAYVYFSQEGKPIKVFVGGYRDNPDTQNREMYQLFEVSLYNMDPTGEWGQDVEAALALADTTVNGVELATQQSSSAVTHEDGSTLDYTSFSALFQPQTGPSLVTVDGYANPLGFTEEEARNFTNTTVGDTLYNGVTLDTISPESFVS